MMSNFGKYGTGLAAIGLLALWLQDATAEVGELDPDFGDGGYTLLYDEDLRIDINGLALSGSGRIIAVGQRETHSSPNTRLATIATLSAEGELLSDVGSQLQLCGPVPAAFLAITPEPAGSLIAGGYAQTSCAGHPRDMWLFRLNADGSTASIFQRADPGNFAYAYAMVIQDDGKIVAVGRATTATTFGAWDFAVARWHADGTLDADFGNNGVLRLDLFGHDDDARSVAILAGGKILISGWIGASPSGRLDIGIVRLNADGSLDDSFGTNGVVTHDLEGFNDLASDMVLLPDNRFILAGRVGVAVGDSRFFIARFNADGSLDTSFGSGGLVRPDLGEQFSFATAVTRQYNGKLIAVGGVDTGDGTWAITVVRVTADGQLDPEFNGNGIQTINLFPERGQYATTVALQRTGTITPAENSVRQDILVGGIVGAFQTSDGIVLRLIGDSDYVFRDRFEIQSE